MAEEEKKYVQINIHMISIVPIDHCSILTSFSLLLSLVKDQIDIQIEVGNNLEKRTAQSLDLEPIFDKIR